MLKQSHVLALEVAATLNLGCGSAGLFLDFAERFAVCPSHAPVFAVRCVPRVRVRVRVRVEG